MSTLIRLIAVLVLLFYAFPSEAQVPTRRWIVQASDGKLLGFTDDQDVDPPDAAFASFVLESVIRAADPPGATGDITPLGTWDGRDLHGTFRRRNCGSLRSHDRLGAGEGRLQRHA